MLRFAFSKAIIVFILKVFKVYIFITWLQGSCQNMNQFLQHKPSAVQFGKDLRYTVLYL